MAGPSLRFAEHEDVVFRKAPLETVLCQVRFPPILALLDEVGVAGLQEAVRAEYPDTSSDHQVEFNVGPVNAQVKRSAPIWRMRTDPDRWTVSAAVDFVALETTHYGDWDQFRQRLEFLLAAVDRTLAPGRTKRIGLRKVNLFTHPEAKDAQEWVGLLRPELIGIAGLETPGTVALSFSEVHYQDNAGGTLTARFGPDREASSKFRVDLDYWNEDRFAIMPSSSLVHVLAEYASSMTSFFHWIITPRLKEHLEPVPRSRAVEET